MGNEIEKKERVPKRGPIPSPNAIKIVRTVRLTEQEASAVDQAAGKTGKTVSQVIREAIRQFIGI